MPDRDDEKPRARNPVLTPHDIERLPEILDFYERLSPEAREFVLGLREDDVDLMRKGLKTIIAIEATGRVLKWTAITFIAAVATMATLGESVMKVLGWMRAIK